tara:strand:- start:1264 stop:1467 length:204 start_codon:yes stop_codon:yes gene_type:complete
MDKIEPVISDVEFNVPLTLKEKIARQDCIDKIKTEISHYTSGVKSSPKLAFFYNDKIRGLENKLAAI